ncbi:MULTISPECIES: PRC-barrel domain-containing protein [unclassified Roseofilum]|uniref:PRC-barrel domain-containing protein n=1 Tax=unclassified Roseofilum TaxID=2620099 RepID=UPI001B008EBF|nr:MULTISPECIES: PRC-barrel domain-containing protein [unclassified Roseofilum]MBP0008405.1 PRC-barrel domain-containing protein [Roseofilum sp. Belize Diploria]MBP0033303.1 PRC-barrel domain-containing protein [Roseofilum sp. Belize BBD 4]
MISEKISQRSDFLGTQVITRNNGKRLGVVSQLWVDIDRREVVALSLRDNLLSGVLAGIPRYMYLSNIRQVGDVILVDDDDVIEDVNVEVYSSLIGSEVITEAGEMLGKVRGYRFDTEDYRVTSLIIASIGLPLIPEQVVSTYELTIDQIVSSGPNRLIVFEGAEEQMVQLSVGVLEKLGISQAPWEREGAEPYAMPIIDSEKRLGTGTPIRTEEPIREMEPVMEETWNADEWQKPQPAPMRQFQQPEPRYEQSYEEDNWGGDGDEDRSYREPSYRVDPPEVENEEIPETPYEPSYREIEEDAWADKDQDEPLDLPKVNIPETRKKPEYEG